jgi:hypothetical protein
MLTFHLDPFPLQVQTAAIQRAVRTLPATWPGCPPVTYQDFEQRAWLIARLLEEGAE